MGPEDEETAEGTRAWLPEGIEPVPNASAPPQPETSTWRSEDVPSSLRDARTTPESTPQALLELRARVEAVERTLSGAEGLANEVVAEVEHQRGLLNREGEALSTAIAAVFERIDQLAEPMLQLQDLRERVERLETELGTVGRRATMGDALARALSEYGREDASTSAADLAGADRLNKATFEDLRGLGLSITQAARVIATRDARRGFRAPEDLEEVPGLSEQQVEELKRLIEG